MALAIVTGKAGSDPMTRNGTGSHPSSGFTMIELLIVVTLIVVLAGMGLATYSTSINRSKEAVLKEDLFRMRDAIDQY